MLPFLGVLINVELEMMRAAAGKIAWKSFKMNISVI
jgi:hypothetical protein